MSDSEDSDGEGGLGNVSRVIIRPPGHSGKAKRGHLCFDAAFETGNLGRADLVGEFEYDLFLRPDTCNPRYRFWFNFTVDNTKQDQRVIFNIVNISKNRNLFKFGLTPIVKSSGRPKWQRIPKHHVFYYRSPVHQNHYVLSFAFAFEKEDEIYQFAVAPPFSYSRLQAYISALDGRFHDKFERTTLTQSLQQRKLELITIDHVPKPMKIDSKNAIRVIVVLARSHPGESVTSFVCQGFLEFLLGSHPIATILRENFVFKVIPMVNPDGVFLGNNRCNLIGQDLNRAWNIATEFSHPTIVAIKNMLKELDSSESYQIDFVLDLHAHTTSIGSFIYGNTYEDVYRYERHLVFPKLLSSKAADFSNMMFNADERKSGSARRFCCEKLSDSVNAYTLEISMCGYQLKGTQIIAQYTEDDYMRYGRNIVRTLLQYYRFTNILTIPMVNELKSKKHRPKTHRSRSRIRQSHVIKPRPNTTRAYAPISYNDLELLRDYSSTSNECSPTRSGFGSRLTKNIYLNINALPDHHKPDQYSLLSIHASKFKNLDFSDSKSAKSKKLIEDKCGFSNVGTTDELLVNVPPKPSLSIIDFNQLTRGALEKAKRSASEGRCRHSSRIDAFR
ncbi:cytosolic carboxypeptidase 6 isoform X2 [Contarinia nasturtii]|uniref:cytosolic carboxypeptidase 6 isoform X2 n=1 Tax=Contarinia nasturtii TaxID=265458 RepID=UPI0012D48DB8|nr:cytosolic carboxypeptidase 6 isoform X2 [Contarinia nasturtii]